jgi:predicted Zn-dependent protease
MVFGIPLLMGAGCNANPLSISQSDEIQIGQQAAADLERQYGVVNDPTGLTRINRIGRSIAAVSTRPGLPWSFKILNDASVNALALPGGPVYVTRGLLALPNLSDSELSGVIGHEIAHINQQHSVKAIEKAMTYQLLSDLVLGHSAASIQAAANLAVQYAVELPNSRQNEYEADNVGTRLAYNAGYPANGLLAFLNRLQSLTGSSRTPTWLSTHPLTSDRIAREQQLVASLQTQRRPVAVALTEDEQKIMKALGDEEAAPKVEDAVTPADDAVPQPAAEEAQPVAEGNEEK